MAQLPAERNFALALQSLHELVESGRNGTPLRPLDGTIASPLHDTTLRPRDESPGPVVKRSLSEEHMQMLLSHLVNTLREHDDLIRRQTVEIAEMSTRLQAEMQQQHLRLEDITKQTASMWSTLRDRDAEQCAKDREAEQRATGPVDEPADEVVMQSAATDDNGPGASRVTARFSQSGTKGEEVFNITESVLRAHASQTSLLDASERFLQARMWEGFLLFGLHDVGHAGSLVMLIVLLLNVTLQTVFCAVVGVSFLGSPYASPETYALWRETEAHTHAHYDTALGVSLVSRVCKGDKTLTIANSQQDVYEEIILYSKPLMGGVFGDISRGASLAAVVIFMWFLIVTKELQDAGDYFYFIRNLPVSKHTGLVRSLEDGTMTMVSVSWWRRECVVGLVVVRAAFAIVLLVMGSLWLANTKILQESVLNASALGFVLEIDQILFDTLMPFSCVDIIHKLQPLRIKRPPTWKGLTWFNVWNLVICFAWTFCFILFNVMREERTMQTIADHLCGGQQDFITAITQATRDVVWMPTNRSYVPDDMSTRLLFTAKATRELIHGEDVHPTLSWISHTWRSMEEQRTMSVEGLLKRGGPTTACDEFRTFEELPTQWLAPLRQWSGQPDAKSCADMIHICHDPRYALVRIVCPVSCGCQSPYSPLFRNGEHDGCPRFVCMATDKWKRDLASIPCMDFNSTHLAALQAREDEKRALRNYLFDWEQAMLEDMGQLANDKYRAFRDDFLESGCRALRNGHLEPGRSIRDLCSPDVKSNGFATWCPETCGCRNVTAAEMWMTSVGQSMASGPPLWRVCPSQCLPNVSLTPR